MPVAILRRKVREALNMAPGFGKSEGMIHQIVNELTGGGVDLQDLRDARDWNHQELYIRREKDEDSDEYLWYITERGIAKQKI